MNHQIVPCRERRIGRGAAARRTATMTAGFRVHFLGTNGWYDSPTGATPCVLVDTPEYGVILDAGIGLARLDSVTSLAKPFYLLLSHLHLDHLFGLHTLVKLRFRELAVVVSRSQLPPLRFLLARPFTVAVEDLGYPVRLLALEDAAGSLPFQLEALPLRHPVPTNGFRLSIGQSVIAYVCDTAPCENAVALARGADLMVAECSFRSGEVLEPMPHLNPELAAELADRAGARQLVLTHFDASRYASHEQREAACIAARRLFPRTRWAADGLVVEVGGPAQGS